jgi:hypothetical protein
MTRIRLVLPSFFALLIVPIHLIAQENPKPESKKPAVSLKVQVVLAESEGEKKLASLPYTFFLKAAESGPVPPPWTKVRIGSRVPVHAGKEGGLQYIDVGTNIDSRGFLADDGRFDIYLNLERSWVEGEVVLPAEKSSAATSDSESGHFKEPIIRQFKTELNLTMRDGQTTQTTQAADPLSGRLLTITVTVNVVK